MASAGTAYVDVEAKLDSLESDVNAAIDGLSPSVDVVVDASVDGAQADIDSLEASPIDVPVNVDTEQAQEQIGGLGESISGLFSGEGGDAGGGLGDFAASAGLLGASSMTAATGGLAALGLGLGYAASEAMDAEQVVAQLDQMVANMGSNAGVTSGGLQALATDIQQTAGFSDEAVMSGESMVLMFENVRNVAGQPIFDRTIKASADLARSPAFNGDITSAARTLGRALDDPTAGMGRLRRAGIQLSEAQQEQIKGLQESGDTLGAQAALLDIVEGKVNGLADAYGGTLAGSLDRTKEKLGENAEQIGGIVLPAVNALVGGLSDLTSSAYDFGYAIGEGWQGRAMQGPEQFIQGIGTVVGDLPPAFLTAAAASADLATAADDAGYSVSNLGDRIDSYLTGIYSVPEAQRSVRDSFHDLFATLLTEGHTADDVAASMEKVVRETANLGVATGDMPGAAAVSIASLRGMRDSGQVTTDQFRDLRSAIENIPGARQTAVSAPGATEARSQVSTLTDALMGIPPGRDTRVSATGLSGVYNTAVNYRQELDQLDGRHVTSYVGIVTTGSATARASGGPVESGSQYLVGEEGPEMFVPRQSGTIIPAPQTAALMGGGGVHVGQITVHAPSGNGDDIARAVTDAIRKLERAGR